MPSRPDGSHGNPTGKPWQACSATHPPGLRIRVATACALERQPHRDQRTAPGMRARPSKRRCRKPSRAHVAGRCPRSHCRGIPSVSVTSENGAEYIGHISLGQGSDASAHPCGGGYYVTSPVIILADMPMGGGSASLWAERVSQWRLSLSAAAGTGARSAVGWIAQL